MTRAKTISTVLFGAVLMASAVTSCSSTISGSASVTITPTGGTLRSPDGHLTVTLPPGAVSQNTTVTVAPIASSSEPEALRNFSKVGSAYRLSPGNVTFAKPVSISMTETETGATAIVPVMLRLPDGSSQPQFTSTEKTDINLGKKTVTVTGTTTHFSTYLITGAAAVSLIPSSVSAQVGQGWTSNVTITNMVSAHGGMFFSSMINVDGLAIFALEPIVPTNSTYKQNITVPNSPGTYTVDPAPSYTCGAPGSGSFGMSMEIVTNATKSTFGLNDRTTVEGSANCTQNTTTSSSTTSSTTSTTIPPAPQVSGIHADFNQGLFTTMYDVNASGGTGSLSYAWSISMQADPNCGSGFKASPNNANQAAWFHADTSKGGPCDHSQEGANGHPGTVQVVVSDQYWNCTASYQGTNTGDGTSPACTRK